MELRTRVLRTCAERCEEEEVHKNKKHSNQDKAAEKQHNNVQDGETDKSIGKKRPARQEYVVQRMEALGHEKVFNMFCFVLETVRIKFVLVLSYLNSNTTSVNRSMILVTNKSTILSVNRSITLSTNKNLQGQELW